MDFSSRHIEETIREFSKLPGVGRKTATRFALYILKSDQTEVDNLIRTLTNLKSKLKPCKICHNISESETCPICTNANRDHSTVCVVEDLRDLMAIESTQQYKGAYHLLGGIISPIDGIGPSDLNIDSLVQRISSGEIKEVIMALSTTMEGDTTNFYIYKRIQEYPVRVSTIARGIAIGDQLEYADEITLARSLTNRIPYENVLPAK